MKGFFQKLNKIPVKLLVIVYIVLSFALPFIFLSQNIDYSNPVFYILNLPVMLCSILLIIRFINYLKAKGASGYNVVRYYLSFALILFPAILFIIVDKNESLNGFLMIPGLSLEAGLLIWLLVRYLKKQWKKERRVREETSSSYTFEDLCDDLLADREIEFTYDNVRYLFIPENGRYYFKRIVATDPYEYKVLAEAGNALVCIDASSVNGKKISGLWPDIEDITVYK